MNLDIRGVAYHIEAEGTTSHERTAVLLHGFSGSSLDWNEIVTKLRALDRGVVTIDLVGHGKTESPPDPARYTMTETVRDLAEIASRVGITEADWVGYSMGGRVALHLALAHPARVRSLVLESSSAGVEDDHGGPGVEVGGVEITPDPVDLMAEPAEQLGPRRRSVGPVGVGRRRRPAPLTAPAGQKRRQRRDGSNGRCPEAS